jgi:hypothetical protein
MNLPGKITAQGSAVAQQPTRRELMDRMGHSSTRAAYIYQHRTALRQCRLACWRVDPGFGVPAAGASGSVHDRWS